MILPSAPAERVRRGLLIMADYGADPVWSANGRTAERLEEIPVSEETRSALRAWQARYDELPAIGFAWPPGDRETFDRKGRELWGRVAEELGDAWRVGYFSELEGRALWCGPAGGAAA
jgi:hypothetical protein